MQRTGILLLLGLSTACHGYFGDRTDPEDIELNNFAEARQRAATYYDGGDYVRAAGQYQKALEYRPKHIPSRLGNAYSLLATDIHRHIQTARRELERMGKPPLRDSRMEVKRVYGLARANLKLAVQFQRRSLVNREKGHLEAEEQDRGAARGYARDALAHFDQVMKIDQALADQKIVGPQRVSASLTPDCHVGMAYCEIILGDAEHTGPFLRAEEHMRKFAKVAKNARTFWHKRRERLMQTDPLREGEKGSAGPTTMNDEERRRYEERIARTVLEEVAVRRELLDTYLYLNKYRRAIDECGTILALDESVDEILFLRARAYTFLRPPNYRAALRDMKAYRDRQDLGRLTRRLVHVRQHIKRLEAEVEREERAAKNGLGG